MKKTLYQRAKEGIRAVALGGLTALSLAGCKSDEQSQSTGMDYFDTFSGFTDGRNDEREVRGGPYGSWDRNIVGIATGDFDGDGDLDIVIATSRNGIKLYENKMAQASRRR
ncbi:MAG: hypothetical protein AABX50_00385 [Nanoarchaeota archaeon]